MGRPPLAVGWIGLQASAYVTDLNFRRYPIDGAGGVFKKGFLLVRTRQTEELAGLGAVIVVQTMVPKEVQSLVCSLKARCGQCAGNSA